MINVITADTGPLIHLASQGLLDSLYSIGNVIVVDVVEIEATREGKPYAQDIQRWICSGLADGRLKIAKTTTGETVRVAMSAQPNFRQKDGGERAIIDWLLDEISITSDHAMIIYENGKIPKMIQNFDVDANATILTTKSFLLHCMENNIIRDAEIAWGKMLDEHPTMNPKEQATIIRKSGYSL